MARGMTLCLFLALGAAVLFVLFSHQGEEQHQADPASAEEAITPATPAQALPTETSKAHQSARDGRSASLEHRIQPFLEAGCVEEASLWFYNMPPVEERAFDQWLADHGFFGGLNRHWADSLAQFDDYGSYDSEVLKRLAKGGDGKAQLALAIHHHNDDDFEKAAHWMWEAVIQGYTQPLRDLWLVKYRAMAAELDEDDFSPDKRRELMLRHLSYADLYERRGGPFAEFNRRILHDHLATRDPDDSWGLDEADFETIQDRSDALFASLEAERIRRGLGPFQQQKPAIAEKAREEEKLLLRLREEGLNPCR